MESAAAVPLTMTVSAWPSPVPLPGVPARSRFTSVTPVPDRSLTVRVSAPPSAATLTCSTPLTSMVTLPTSRNSRSRLPLADRSMFSLALEPLNCKVSVPPWPSTVSLPSPGFHTNVSLPVPRKATSLPRPPTMVSLPSPPISMSLPSPPVMLSLPAPPSTVSPTVPADSPAAVTESLPPRAFTTSWSLAPSEPWTATMAGKPATV